MRRVVTILAFFFISGSIHARQENNYHYYDTLTYRQYLQGDWKNLKKTATEALRKGYDYYYMRMRLGIAFYETKHYRQAISHFRKALSFNAGDPVALEYLYYSLLFAGRESDARALIPELSPSFTEEKGIKRMPSVTSLQLHYQASMNENESGSYNYIPPPSPPDFEGMQFLSRSFHVLNAVLEHTLSSRFRLLHQYSFMSKKDLYYFNDLSNEYFIPERRTKQHQYYLNTRTGLYQGGLLSCSFHYLYVNSPAYYFRQGFGSYQLIAPEFMSNDMVFHMAFSQEAGNFNFEVSGSFSTINSLEQWQQNLQMIWYPFGNLHLYSVSAFSRIAEYNQGSFLDERYVFRQKFGWRLAGPVWTEIFGYTGKMENYNDHYGSMVFNALDHIHYMLGGNLILLTKENTQINLGYTLSSLTSNYHEYPSSGRPGINEYVYRIHSLNTGIKWNF